MNTDLVLISLKRSRFGAIFSCILGLVMFGVALSAYELYVTQSSQSRMILLVVLIISIVCLVWIVIVAGYLLYNIEIAERSLRHNKKIPDEILRRLRL